VTHVRVLVEVEYSVSPIGAVVSLNGRRDPPQQTWSDRPMIQQRTATPDIARVGPLAAVVLVAGLTFGFIAGQAAPDIFDSLGASSVTVTTTLPQNADYGVRHMGLTQSLGVADDFATRHMAPPLTEVDDFGTRHSTSTPLAPADDYGVRHGDQ
jgi:hypothetical protein